MSYLALRVLFFRLKHWDSQTRAQIGRVSWLTIRRRPSNSSKLIVGLSLPNFGTIRTTQESTFGGGLKLALETFICA